EALRTGRVLDGPVERDVLADDDLSHSGSPFAGVLSYHRGPANAHLPARSLKSCLRYPAWLGLPSRASCLAGSRRSAFGPPGPRREPCRTGRDVLPRSLQARSQRKDFGVSPTLTTKDGAFMEPRGWNRWQAVANRVTAEAAETSQIRCHRLQPVAARW